jgi:transcriptional regulator with XRE-family HTH domain
MLKRTRLIKDWMKNKKVTRLELAKMMECTPKHISYFIHGQRNFSAGKLLRISKITGISIEDLLEK